MRELNTNVVIIGAGSAGMTAYQAARKVTDKVLLIEGQSYGTTCARVGCMPSKLLISAAERVQQIREAETFGVQLEGPFRIDGRAVMDRVRRERDRFAGAATAAVEAFPAEHRLWGHARFTGPNQIEVDDHTRIHARAVVIATGSMPQRLPMFAGAGKRLLVNDDVFNWKDLPTSLAVFGPGVIGLELGQALHRLGVRIRMFGKGGMLGPITDEKIRAQALELFSHEFYLDTDADVQSLRETNDQVEIDFKDHSGTLRTERFDYVLTATGRIPLIQGLGLETTGLRLDSKGMPAFDPNTLQCGNSSIFIAGDANGYRPLLHEAADEGRIAGANAARFPDVRSEVRRSALAVVFTAPQIAMVGSSFIDLPEGGFAVGEFSFQTQSRARIMNVNQGVLRVYGERGTGRFLGSEMIVPGAEHFAHLLAWCHQQRLTVDEMLTMPFYHPVLEEGVRGALQSLAKALGESH